MKNNKDERITNYTDDEIVEELVPKIEIAKQSEFYKIPRRFGSIPVDELPLGCDLEKQYYKIYPRAVLPFQKANRVTFGYRDLEPNRLFWGDNLHVLRMLPSNSIDLIYIDPPFFSGRRYNIIFGDQNEVRSFNDIWEGGMPGYLIWLNARLLEMKRVLKPTGSIFVHLDWHASHYVKVEMDKIFGYDNFINEITWQRQFAKHSDAKQNAQHLGRIHDVILLYSKSDKYTWNSQYSPFSEEYVDTAYRSIEPETGRRYQLTAIDGPGGASKGNPRYEFLGITRYWRYSKETMEKLYREGRIVQTKQGNVPRYKRYLDEMKGVELQDLWIDVKPVTTGNESIGYPTQKPELLLERIINLSSNPGDVIADFFCGGGTTPTVAQKLNRRWIACDQSRVAVAITQGRLESLFGDGKKQITLTEIPDISIEYWGTYEVPELEELSNDEFRDFIISAYGGRPSTVGEYIHGFKRETPVFVGSPKQDSQVTKNEVINFAQEISEKKGKKQGIMLAWSFSQSARIAAEKLIGSEGTFVDLIQISLTEIESPEFRSHIIKLHNEYESFLKFILPPEVRVHHKKLSTMTYEFDATESIALNVGASIVNVQWDLDYRGRFTPTKGFAYGRDQKGKPLFKIEYKFEYVGKITIACRVQDDLGGEKIYTEVISVS